MGELVASRVSEAVLALAEEVGMIFRREGEIMALHSSPLIQKLVEEVSELHLRHSGALHL